MILAILAHPDDETFSCGGLLATHALDGESVAVMVCADGVTSRGNATPRRWNEYEAACEALGLTANCYSLFPDQQADTTSRLDLARSIHGTVDSRAPSLVYTHFPGDLNVDHRRVAEAVLVATRGVCPVRYVRPEWPSRSLWPWQPTSWAYLTVAAQERRVAAGACYASELREWPHPRSLERLRRESTEGYIEIPQWS